MRNYFFRPARDVKNIFQSAKNNYYLIFLILYSFLVFSKATQFITFVLFYVLAILILVGIAISIYLIRNSELIKIKRSVSASAFLILTSFFCGAFLNFVLTILLILFPASLTGR